MTERIYSLFQQSVEAKMHVGEQLAPLIEQAGNILVDSLLNEGKVLICGNGTSAALAQIFSSALIDRYEQERPSLPAIWLGSNVATYTAISADTQHANVYAKPIRALGTPNDTLVVISTSGNSANLLQAVRAAHERNLRVIALTGRDGGDIAKHLNEHDIEIRVELPSRGRIHEVHLLIIFCLCNHIDFNLFGLE